MRIQPWARAAVAMFAVGWGANQFTSLLLAYRAQDGLSATVTDALFAVYAVGLIPTLLLIGPLSDRLGRRSMARIAVLGSIVATTVLILGDLSSWFLYPGRFLAGVASGAVFAPGTAWVKELSSPPYAPSGAADSGARRAAVALSAGFSLGPMVAGLISQWAPAPLVTPYVAHPGRRRRGRGAGLERAGDGPGRPGRPGFARTGFAGTRGAGDTRRRVGPGWRWPPHHASAGS